MKSVWYYIKLFETKNKIVAARENVQCRARKLTLKCESTIYITYFFFRL